MKKIPVSKFNDKNCDAVNVFASRHFCSKSVTHCHNHFEIEKVVSGKADSVINAQSFSLEKGCAYVMRPADIHSIECLENSTLEIFNISFLENAFSRDVVDSFLYNGNVNTCVLNEEELKKIVALFNVLNDEQEKMHPDKEIIYGCANVIIRLLLQKINVDVIEDTRDFMTVALRNIGESFRDKLSLEMVAAKAGVTPQYFSKVFHEKMVFTFKQYVTQMRISYARNLIRYGKVSATQACFDCGFNSYSAFVKAFVESTGVLPRKYSLNYDIDNEKM